MSKVYVITKTHRDGDVEFVSAYALHAEAENFCNSVYSLSGTGCWKEGRYTYICIDEVDFIGMTDE